MEYTFFRILGELKEIFGNLDPDDIQIPPEHVKADISLTGDPGKMEEFAGMINSGKFEYLEKAESEGPFLNIILKKKTLYDSVLENLEKLWGEYGVTDLNLGKFAVIEYSSPNVARPIGVGHLRSTIIGQVLSNIYESTGYIVLRDNYLGDWGTQFGKLIYAYQTWGDKEKIKKDPIRELKSLYIKFQEESEKDEKLVEEARNILKKLEEENGKLTKLWKKFRKLSIKEFKKIYEKLGVDFDHYGGESMFLEKAKEIPEECLEEEICQKGEGKEIIAEVDDLPTFLLRKGDGSTIYHSRDLAQLRFRVEEFSPDDILYVVGSEQTLYFRQLFTLARRLGYLDNMTPTHIGFGLVLGEDGKRMSTRHGTAVELEDLIKKSIEKSREIIEEKNPELSEKEKEEAARKVGIGAIIYNDISQSREKNISFNWERMLDFEAGSAVYLQYTYARINSIVSKYEEKFGRSSRPKEYSFGDDIEFELAKKIMFFPKVVSEARKNDSPHNIAVYLEELAGLFNTFYNKISIIRTKDKNLRESRLSLAKGIGRVLKNGLEILNVPVPGKM